MPGVDAMKDALDGLIEALSAKSIIGEPIEMEDKIIIPITKMGIGFGADIGRGGRDASLGGPTRCGAGGSVGIFPVAVIVVFKGVAGPEGVKVVPLSPPGELVASTAHAVMEKIMVYKQSREKRIDKMAAVNVD